MGDGFTVLLPKGRLGNEGRSRMRQGTIISPTPEPHIPLTAVCLLGKEGAVFFLKEISGYKNRRDKKEQKTPMPPAGAVVSALCIVPLT